mmetsp:Transcript_37812/g.88396  ORF Transcript_37812/g.88396 Transcript_37812/m.88396 type:complete len:218 (+) Transcript_37812:212-865(+)
MRRGRPRRSSLDQKGNSTMRSCDLLWRSLSSRDVGFSTRWCSWRTVLWTSTHKASSVFPPLRATRTIMPRSPKGFPLDGTTQRHRFTTNWRNRPARDLMQDEYRGRHSAMPVVVPPGRNGARYDDRSGLWTCWRHGHGFGGKRCVQLPRGQRLARGHGLTAESTASRQRTLAFFADKARHHCGGWRDRQICTKISSPPWPSSNSLGPSALKMTLSGR